VTGSFLQSLKRLIPGRLAGPLSRRLHWRERRAFLSKRRAAGDRSLVAFHFWRSDFHEHIRDLIAALDHSSTHATLVVGPTRLRDGFDFGALAKAREPTMLRYGRDIFRTEWLSEAAPAVLFDLATSRLLMGGACPRILYAHGLGGLNFAKFNHSIVEAAPYDALFLNGPMHRRTLEAAAAQHGVRLPALYEVGYMRGDRLRARAATFDPKAFRAARGLPDLPIVIFAPSWGVGAAADEWLEPMIQACEFLGVALFLRLHPNMFRRDSTYHTGGENWPERLRRAQAGARHVRLDVGDNIDDLLLAADVLVTDFSGLGPEFLSLGKPAIFLPADEFFAQAGHERSEAWCRGGDEPRTPAELTRAIREAVQGRGHLLDMGALVYNPAKSVAVAVAALSDVQERHRV
jgi:hypothetical protein